jgi:SAM-dependent methyltransferase
VGYNNNKTAQEIALNEMFKALKPGGYLIFAENLKGSAIHSFLRGRFISWGNMWRYMSVGELLEMTKKFDTVTYKTCGFFGAFGRKEYQRMILGVIDYILSPFISCRCKYIAFFVCRKGI